MFRIKRVYDPPAPEDGLRVLVERLWPRGLSKERAAVDLWLKEVAPSPELRRWFNHDYTRWEEFRRRYEQELAGHSDALQLLREKSLQGTVTLVYAARDTERNSAVVLYEYLAAHPAPEP